MKDSEENLNPLEMQRYMHRHLELLQEGLSQAIAYKEKFTRDQVVCDYLIVHFIDSIYQFSLRIKNNYGQNSQLVNNQINQQSDQNEIQSSSQQFIQHMNTIQGANSSLTVGNFEDKICYNFEKDIYQILAANYDVGVEQDQENSNTLYTKFVIDTIKFCEKIFNSEESNGKYLDLNTSFKTFKSIRNMLEFQTEKNQLNEQQFGPIKPQFKVPDDYLSWLQQFHKIFLKISLNTKINCKEYTEYLFELSKYLTLFLRKTRPLSSIQSWQEDQQNQDHSKTQNFQQNILETPLNEEKEFEEIFQEEWNQCSLYGWEQILQQLNEQNNQETEDKDLITTICKFCQKDFKTIGVYQNHLQGKKHIQAKQNSQSSNQQFINKIKTIAMLESWIFNICQNNNLLSHQLIQTQNQVRKKQSSSYEEILADTQALKKQGVFAINSLDEISAINANKQKSRIDQNGNLYMNSDSDDDDGKIKHNPKNLPIGWDGKPIPYWLYKLHGLGEEFKCEICGGASYWGNKAFEKHFQQWRHAYGMKCLKIPNTVHFKNITDIEEALKLHKKILGENYQKTFKPDYEEEFEDQEGNVLPRKVYIDLKRQGII